jgi:hypothetical protein
MKKLFTLVNSTLLLTICGTVFSQSGDAALAGVNYQNEINSNQNEINSKETKKLSEPSAPKEMGNAAIELAPITFESFKMIDRTRSEKKVGPQGEELILRGNRYYYLNEKGKKVKVKKNDLKSMPKHS